jgi:hypothetical protein
VLHSLNLMVLKIKSKRLRTYHKLCSNSNAKIMLDDLEDITPIGIDNLPTPIALKAKTSVSKSSTAIIKADPAPKVSNLKKQDMEAVVGEYDDEDEDQYEESEGEYDDEDDNTRVSKNELKAKSKHTLSHYI